METVDYGDTDLRSVIEETDTAETEKKNPSASTVIHSRSSRVKNL